MHEQEYDDQREQEPEEHTSSAQSNRSRYFFALMSFLVALIFLSVYLNNYYGLLSGWLLLLGTFAFGAIGVFFLLPQSRLNRAISTETGRNHPSSEGDNNVIEADTGDGLGEGEDAGEGELSSFEILVEEALSSLPAEFQQKMENVLVRVQYEPGVKLGKHL